MPLGTQLVDIPFAGGLSTKLDGVIVGKEKLLALQNATFNKNGTLQRRDPWALLPGSTSVFPVEMATLNGELLAVGSDSKLYSYSPSGASVVSRGHVPEFQLQLDSIAKSQNLKSYLAHASTNGFSIYVWEDWLPGASANGLKYTVVDESTGSAIASGAVLDSSTSATQPRVCVGGQGNGYFIICYVSSLNTVTHVASLSMATVEASTGVILASATTLCTDAVALGGGINVQLFDVCSIGSGLTLLAYASGAGSPTTGGVTVLVTNTFGAILNAEKLAIAAGSVSGVVEAVCLAAIDSTTVGLIACDANTNNAYTAIVTYPASVLTVSSTNTFAMAATPKQFGTLSAVLNKSSGKLQVFCSPLSSGNLKQWSTFTLSSANVTAGLAHPFNSLNLSAGTFAGPVLAARPFSSASNVFLAVSIQSALQAGVYVVDMSGILHAVAIYGSHFYDTAAAFQVPSVATLHDGSFSIPVLRQGQLSFSSGTNTTQAGVSRVRLYPGRSSGPIPLWHAQAGGCLYFSGSYMAMYDGAQTAEAGFAYFPEGVTATIPASNGNNGIAGAYQVVALYEWVDNAGQRHQSAPSPPVSVTVTGGAGTSSTGIAMVAPTLQLGVRAGSSSVVFYRTAANGTTFYRVNAPTAPLGNTLSALTMSYTDSSVVQASGVDPITSNEILYTSSGALPNDNPPACNAIASYQGRLVYSNAEDGQDWRFSQYPVAAQGLYFNETLLGVRTPQDAGAISALAQMDDKLILFTPTHKLWVAGSGPNSAGLNGSYSAPQLLPSDVGCIDQRGLALLPDVSAQDGSVQLGNQGGLGHQTKHGYYLLDRSLTDHYVGMGADAYLGSGVATPSAVVLEDKHQLRVTCPSGVAVFDYLMGQWSTFVTSAAVGISSAVVWNGLWTCGSSSVAGLFQDSAGLSRGDLARTAVVISGTTAWARLAAMQGFERVRRAVLFGPYSAASTITVTPYYNYDTSLASTPASVSSASVVTGDGLRWQFRWHLPVQKCEAIRFVFTDTPTGGNYSGVGFSGMTLEVGVKRGTHKLPAGASV